MSAVCRTVKHHHGQIPGKKTMILRFITEESHESIDEKVPSIDKLRMKVIVGDIGDISMS